MCVRTLACVHVLLLSIFRVVVFYRSIINMVIVI